MGLLWEGVQLFLPKDILSSSRRFCPYIKKICSNLKTVKNLIFLLSSISEYGQIVLGKNIRTPLMIHTSKKFNFPMRAFGLKLFATFTADVPWKLSKVQKILTFFKENFFPFHGWFLTHCWGLPFDVSQNYPECDEFFMTTFKKFKGARAVFDFGVYLMNFLLKWFDNRKRLKIALKLKNYFLNFLKFPNEFKILLRYFSINFAKRKISIKTQINTNLPKFYYFALSTKINVKKGKHENSFDFFIAPARPPKLIIDCSIFRLTSTSCKKIYAHLFIQ